MPSNVTPISIFSTPTAPVGADIRNAAGVLAILQTYANRDQFTQDAVTPLADIPALKAIASPADGLVRNVKRIGYYFFDISSVAAESLPNVVQPNVGSGRWILSAGHFLRRQLFTASGNFVVPAGVYCLRVSGAGAGGGGAAGGSGLTAGGYPGGGGGGGGGALFSSFAWPVVPGETCVITVGAGGTAGVAAAAGSGLTGGDGGDGGNSTFFAPSSGTLTFYGAQGGKGSGPAGSGVGAEYGPGGQPVAGARRTIEGGPGAGGNGWRAPGTGDASRNGNAGHNTALGLGGAGGAKGSANDGGSGGGGGGASGWGGTGGIGGTGGAGGGVGTGAAGTGGVLGSGGGGGGGGSFGRAGGAGTVGGNGAELIEWVE